MIKYISKRLMNSLIVLFGVITIVFIMARITGDAALVLAPASASEEQLKEIRVKLGIDKSIPLQFIIFLKNVAKGDFGESIAYRRPAMEIIAERLPSTLKLGFITFFLSSIIGVLVGVFLSIKPAKWIEMTSKIVALTGQALPSFWLATMLILIFSIKLHLLPTSGIGGIKHMILPVISLSWYHLSFIMRQMRSSLLDILGKEYIKAARIKGNQENIVIWKHAMKNAAFSVVTMMSIGLTLLLSGQVFIEVIFRWPGIGELMVSSITARDFPVIQAISIIITLIVILVMLIKDMMYVLLDPRIRLD